MEKQDFLNCFDDSLTFGNSPRISEVLNQVSESMSMPIAIGKNSIVNSLIKFVFTKRNP